MTRYAVFTDEDAAIIGAKEVTYERTVGGGYGNHSDAFYRIGYCSICKINIGREIDEHDVGTTVSPQRIDKKMYLNFLYSGSTTSTELNTNLSINTKEWQPNAESTADALISSIKVYYGVNGKNEVCTMVCKKHADGYLYWVLPDGVTLTHGIEYYIVIELKNSGNVSVCVETTIKIVWVWK